MAFGGGLLQCGDLVKCVLMVLKGEFWVWFVLFGLLYWTFNFDVCVCLVVVCYFGLSLSGCDFNFVGVGDFGC